MAYQEDWQKNRFPQEESGGRNIAREQDLMWKKMQAAQEHQMMAGNIAVGYGQAGLYGLDKHPHAACTQEAAPPEEREVQRQMQFLDHAINRLVHAVAELNERTRAIQLVQPAATEKEKVASQPSSPLAQVMADAIAMIDGQVEKLEGMNRRIQL